MRRLSLPLVTLLAVSIATSSVRAAERAPSRAKADFGEQVELFQGIENDQLDVKFIPRNSREARVMIENKTNKPLSVKLPEAFAATPVLAQLGGGGMGGGGMGMGGGGMGGGGMGGMGGGFFNVPAEKVGRFKVELVCLEHGKDEPRPAIPYELKPLDQVSSDARVAEVLKQLAAGKTTQRVAQVAAWHLANEMSWDELANKRIEHLNGAVEPYFHPQEVQAAMQLVNTATQLAKQADDQRESLSERHAAEAEPTGQEYEINY